MSSNKKVLITFLGNIHYDTRCNNLYDSLSANNFNVEFIGFDWLTKDFTESRGNVSIVKLEKGFLAIPFYLKFIWHLKLKLLTTKASIIFAEDIYKKFFNKKATDQEMLLVSRAGIVIVSLISFAILPSESFTI